MSKGLRIQTRLVLSKTFPLGMAELTCGKYRIAALPSVTPEKTEALLEFVDAYEAPIGGGSNPEEEANIVCNFLSVIMDSRIKRSGLRVDAIDVPLNQGDRLYSRYKGHLPNTDPSEYLRRVLSLPLDLARQVTRACRAYSSALDFIPSDPTFAFFLLVVAIECLSSQQAIIPSKEIDVDSKKCERFCTFIEKFLPDAVRGKDERTSALFPKLLKTVYYSHRSGFVHRGKEVSAAAIMADRAGSTYFKHATDAKEVRTPGLGWFAGVVRGAILGYLSAQQPAENPIDDLIAQLAFEKATLKLKAKRDLQAGQVVTFDDVDYH